MRDQILRRATHPETGVISSILDASSLDASLLLLPELGLLVVSGEDSLNLSEFGIPPPALFMIKIDPEVKVRLYLEARVAS